MARDSQLNTRFVLAGACTLVAVVMIATGVLLSDSRGDEIIGMLGNLGAEILGLAFTVAIIDWLLERKRLNEQAQHLAWRMLHDVDHADTTVRLYQFASSIWIR